MNFKSLLSICLVTVSALSLGYTFDKDVPTSIRTQINADLAFMSSLRGGQQSTLHREIFHGLDGTQYSEFFTSRVHAVGMDSCGNPIAVACVKPVQDSSKIWLTQNYVKFSHPQIAKMMVVYHESRHTETANDNWGHATCPIPFLGPDGQDMKSIWTGSRLEGEPACDETPYGSYGSTVILLKNISKFCANCTDKVKMDAGIYADDQFLRIIDKGAIDQLKKDLYK